MNSLHPTKVFLIVSLAACLVAAHQVVPEELANKIEKICSSDNNTTPSEVELENLYNDYIASCKDDEIRNQFSSSLAKFKKELGSSDANNVEDLVDEHLMEVCMMHSFFSME